MEFFVAALANLHYLPLPSVLRAHTCPLAVTVLPENSTLRSRLRPVSMVSGWGGGEERENYARLLQNLAKYSLHLLILHHTCYFV